MSLTINMTTAKELVIDILKKDLVTFLVSSPGLGKSSLCKEVAKEYGLFVIDIRCSQLDPADLC